MNNALLRTVGLWILRLLVAAVFAMAGSNKLLGAPMMVDMFGKIGFGQGFRYLTGTIEIVAAILILWPRTSLYGALLTMPVLVGAFLTQLTVLHGDVIHVIVISFFAGLLAYLHRPGAAALRGRAGAA